MQALGFYKMSVRDSTNFLDRLVGLLERHKIRYCVIEGQAVNAYAEPVVTTDLDLVVATDQIDELKTLLAEHFHVREFAHGLNISSLGSDLRVLIQKDVELGDLVERASIRSVLGLQLPVAAIEDVLAGKNGTAQEAIRRTSKQLKPLSDIVRLLEVRPDLSDSVPQDIHTRISSARPQE